MFIRRARIRSTERGAYFTYRLVRSERSGDRVRQRTLLNLGSDPRRPAARPGSAGLDVNRLLLDAAPGSELEWADFDHIAEGRDHIERLIRGALQTGAPGVNVLLYGPPGTGKTEFCKVLAERLGATLYSVGEADDDGDEPSRSERLQDLRLAQRLLKRNSASLLLFDEMEDLLWDSAGGGVFLFGQPLFSGTRGGSSRRPTSLRDGAFSRRLMVGCEQRSRPLSGARPTASLNSGSPRSVSLLSLSKGVGVLVAAGDREHAEPQHRRQRVDRPRRVAPLPDAAGQRLGRRSAPRNSTRPPSDEIEPPAKSAVTFLRLTAGRSNGRGVSSVMAAWRFRCLGGNPLGNEFLPESNGLSHVRHLVLRPSVESRTGAPALGSGGLSVAFAPGLSPAPMAAFPVPAHQTGRADFPHPAFGRDHAFACRRPLVLGARRVRPYSSRSLVSGKRTYFPDFTLCLRQSHRRNRRTACRSIAV